MSHIATILFESLLHCHDKAVARQARPRPSRRWIGRSGGGERIEGGAP